ncbi:MrcB family domain-containing protein [Syntrophomonas erecta]
MKMTFFEVQFTYKGNYGCKYLAGEMVMVKQVRSWSKPDGIPGLIGRKIPPFIDGFGSYLQEIMDSYVNVRTNQSFGRDTTVWTLFSNVEDKIKQNDWLPPIVNLRWSVGQGNWARIPWIAFLDSRITNTTQKGIYVVYLFREDMEGLYLTLNQGVTDVLAQSGVTQSEGRRLLRQRAELLRNDFGELIKYGFNLDNDINLHTDSSLGINYEYGTIAYRYYSSAELPDDGILSTELYHLIEVYQAYVLKLEDDMLQPTNIDGSFSPAVGENHHSPISPFINMNKKVEALIRWIGSQGYVYEPWQIAAYIAALKTKPFVILGGVSGTGKSKLPDLVNKATGGVTHLLPVRPDWTDSSDVLGYCDIQGQFRPAPVLNWAREAEAQPTQHHVCIMDEMNLARVEHYFAEILSQIENRHKGDNGGYISGNLLSQTLLPKDETWSKQVLPANMAIVGTVNMDESTYGFSRKVLDRAFTIELSEINLGRWEREISDIVNMDTWPVELWYPRAVRLSELESPTDQERKTIEQVIKVLIEINSILQQSQMQLGYRSRDEIALFVLHAQEIEASFTTHSGEFVDPLDLAMLMKVLPRIIGGSSTIRQVIMELLAWANQGELPSESNADECVSQWTRNKRPSFLVDAKFPRTVARLCLMWERLTNEGFTSFWM